MARYQRHSAEFKDAIIAKIMNRGETSVAEVCANEGINQATAYYWLKRDRPSGMKTKSKKWSAKEKLQAVTDTLTSSEAETGAYLRKEGLHSHQLEDWRSQVLASLAAKQGPTTDERDVRIKELEREVLRKDKALAEASALLILQKKVSLIWGDKDPK